jgi:uncharacterized coiled-coil protein SlyX
MNSNTLMNSFAVTVLSAVASTCLLLSGTAQAVCQDGCFPTDSTALGEDALLSNAAFSNTAIGAFALQHNTDGFNNTAMGWAALVANTTGTQNTASGAGALQFNTTGSYNTANGVQSLFSNTDGTSNTAVGQNTLPSNTTGDGNTVVGAAALYSNIDGNNNTAIGSAALPNSHGSNNIAVGSAAGTDITNGSDNIDIGNIGLSNDSGIIRIGTNGTHKKTSIAGIYGVGTSGGVPVYINSSGKLGTSTSSVRFKENIRDMSDASDVLLSLRPVAFQYKKELDPEKIPQFGLVAEEVEKVAPDLVVRDSDGKPYTVRYDSVNAMLLNEFLKEHRKVEGQGKTIAELRSTIAQQVKGIEALAAQVKEQSAQIQRVSAELAASTARPQVADKR